MRMIAVLVGAVVRSTGGYSVPGGSSWRCSSANIPNCVRMCTTDETVGLQRVQAALLRDASSADALRDTLFQSLSLFPDEARTEDLNEAIADARLRLHEANTGAVPTDHQAADKERELLASIQQLRAKGKSDEEIMSGVQLQPTASPGSGGGDAPPRAPTRGEEAWGSWSQTDAAIALDLYIGAQIIAKEIEVEMAEGWLCVQTGEVDAPPLLFGRLAQPVIASELMWAVDETSDGRRVLCIEVPKKARPAASRASADCVFDESLHIAGTPCLVAGLSQGTITLDLPDVV